MKKLKISLDQDGVLADLTKQIVSHLNRYHGENLTPEDINQWSIHKCCEKTDAKNVYKYFNEPGFFRHLEPIGTCQQFVTKLIEDGHDVCIVTACEEGHACKREWLKNHIPALDQNNIIFTHRKDRVFANVFVDDRIENLEKFKAAWPGETAICFEQPYNNDWMGFKANDWEALYLFITKIAWELAE